MMRKHTDTCRSGDVPSVRPIRRSRRWWWSRRELKTTDGATSTARWTSGVRYSRFSGKEPPSSARRNGRKQPLYNGEGAPVYPGRPAGYDGIASSLRLKALRDSIEDYEYLAILERVGLDAFAT